MRWPWCRRGSAPRCGAAPGSSARGRRPRARRRPCARSVHWRKAFSSSAGSLRRRHADAAAAARRLAQHRVADALGRRARRCRSVRHHVRRCPAPPARPRRGHQLARLALVLHPRMASGGGPDEDDAGLGAGAGELGVLRHEAVARVNGLGARLLRRLEDGVDVEVAVLGGRGAQAHRLVRLLDEGQLRVRVRNTRRRWRSPSPRATAPMRRAISPRLAMSSEQAAPWRRRAAHAATPACSGASIRVAW